MQIFTKGTKIFSLFFVSAAFIAGCSSSDDAAAIDSLPEELNFKETSVGSEVSFEEKENFEPVISSSLTTISTTTKAEKAPSSELLSSLAPLTTSSSPNASVSPSTATTVDVAPAPLASCATADYQMSIPQGWNTAPLSSSLHCSGFTTINLPASLECDCTISVTVATVALPAADVIADLTSASIGNVSVTSVLGGSADLVTGDWPLSEVQSGDSGSSEQRRLYVFDDGNQSIVVAAGSFSDYDTGYTFSAGVAAVDQIAASLVIL